MAKVNAELKADYGYSCCGYGYGSEETIELEITANELDTLQQIDANKVSRDSVVAAIDKGANALQDLHNKIDNACFYMVEDYWLFEADNEFLQESLTSSMEADLESGEFIPVSLEEFVTDLKSGGIDFEGLRFGYFDEIDEDFDFDDEESLEDLYNDYILNIYYDWVCEHDHRFIAERVGLDIDACRDEDTIDYTILINA